MKTVNVLMCCIVLVCLMFNYGCAINSKPKIAFMFPNSTMSRMKVENDAFTQKAASLGAEVITTDAKNSEHIQLRQADSVMEAGAKVIALMAVNANTAAAIVRKAHDNGVKIIAYDRIINNCKPDYYISFDNIKIGSLMAEYAVRKKPEGNYVILSGDKSDKNAVWVRDGIIKSLQQKIEDRQINIMYDSYVEDWSQENAEYITGKILRLSNIQPDVIITAYDGLARGAIKAINRYSDNFSCIITGQDAEPQTIELIKNRLQAVTIYKPVDKMGELAAEIAVGFINSSSSQQNSTISNGVFDIPCTLLDPVLVDENNIELVYNQKANEKIERYN